MSAHDFFSKFNFNPALRGCVGVENEFYLLGEQREPQPAAPAFLGAIHDTAWTYELGACQAEFRTPPCADDAQLESALITGFNAGRSVAEQLSLQLVACEVGPPGMTLEVYPDERYERIVQTMPQAVLESACRVAGLHIHIGVRDMEEAIEVYNRLVAHTQTFLQLGDHSGGERLRLFKNLYHDLMPSPYASPNDFHLDAVRNGFDQDIRRCWRWIRISRHGTVEVRAFGATDNIREILSWARLIRSLAYPSH